jgi:hypothetical protein
MADADFGKQFNPENFAPVKLDGSEIQEEKTPPHFFRLSQKLIERLVQAIKYSSHSAESTCTAVPWSYSRHRVCAIFSLLRASAETTEKVKRLSHVTLPFRVLVFLFMALGGTLVASLLVAPKKGVACCSAEVCAREHHHQVPSPSSLRKSLRNNTTGTASGPR